MNKYIAECIGTFALVFCGTGAIIINEVSGGVVTHGGVAFTFGCIVTAMIYALGDVSGAHMNPAVTVGFWVAKRFPRRDVVPYIVSQLFGAILASGVLFFLFPEAQTRGETIPADSVSQSFVLEFILTYFLMFVIMQVATGSKEVGIMAGLAIGLTVLLEAMFAGPICGASMNPTRSIAPALFGNTAHLWAYIVAPTLGAIAAVGTWKAIKDD